MATEGEVGGDKCLESTAHLFAATLLDGRGEGRGERGEGRGERVKNTRVKLPLSTDNANFTALMQTIQASNTPHYCQHNTTQQQNLKKLKTLPVSKVLH